MDVFPSAVDISSTQPKSRTKRKSAREAILDAAETLFASHGYYGTSTHDVAAATGVKQSLIAYHFGSKENLYRAMIARRAVAFSQLILDGLAQALAQDGPVTLEAILEAFIRPVFEQFRPGSPGIYRDYARLLGQGAHLARSPTLHDSYDRVYSGVVSTYRYAIIANLPGMTENAVRCTIDFLHGAVGTLIGAGNTAFIDGLNQAFDGPEQPDLAFDLWIAKLVTFCAAGCRKLAAAERS